VYADWLTTVSPTYAQEIQTPEHGHGLDGVLRTRSDRLVGILNGIDVAEWDPSRDPHIPTRYRAEQLAGKRASKLALQAAFGLPAGAEAPLAGIITRLADQKGVDLLLPIVPALVERNLQLVMLGSGDPAYEDAFRILARRFPHHVGVKIAYDARLAHLIEAGADMFLMPSRYEPCGLNQMMSLRYGTPPVVRATGGLADTVVETPEDARNGFRFEAYDSTAFLAAIDRALAQFADPARWETLMRRGMAADFSWDASARRYADVYSRATGQAPAGLAVAGRAAVGRGERIAAPAALPASPGLAAREPAVRSPNGPSLAVAEPAPPTLPEPPATGDGAATPAEPAPASALPRRKAATAGTGTAASTTKAKAGARPKRAGAAKAKGTARPKSDLKRRGRATAKAAPKPRTAAGTKPAARASAKPKARAKSARTRTRTPKGPARG
jgi:hypothetical protein